MPTQSMNLRHATFFSRRCGRVQLELVRRKKGCKMKLKFLKVFIFIMIAVNAVLCVCATDLEKVWLDGAWQYKDKDGVIWRIINITDGVNKWVRLGGGSSAAIDVNTIGDVVIPSESVTDTAKPISEIYKKAFYNCNKLTSVVVPASVTSIRDYAFWGCASITNVNVSEKVLLGRQVFKGCVSLAEDDFVVMAKVLYDYIGSLAELKTPSGVTVIDASAFGGLSCLRRIEISEGVERIYENAFKGCVNLERVTFPQSITNISYEAFCECNNLRELTVGKMFCETNLFSVMPYTYQSITNVVVADGVTQIGVECFKGCSDLARIVVPASVTVIYDRAFKDCVSLKELIFLGDAPDVGEDILIGTPKTLKIKVLKDTIGWNGGVSTDLPEVWPVSDFVSRKIIYSSEDTESGESGSSSSGSSGVESVVFDPRYDLAEDIADRAIANVEIDGDTAIDSFVLKGGKAYDAVVRIVNVSAADVKVSLPADYKYEKFKGTNPLVIPASSTNLLTITRTKGDTFLLSREELVLEEQK